MRLIFIRHAEPDYEHDSLTEKGWREAKLLARRTKDWQVDEFYVSPLGRARDTASFTLREHGKTAEVMDWLHEFQGTLPDGNGAERLCWDLMPDVWTAQPELLQPAGWEKAPILQGTNVKAEYDRVTAGLDALLASYGYMRHGGYYTCRETCGKTIVCFCHFGITAVLLSHLWNVSPFTVLHGAFLAPSSVTVLNAEERQPGIAYFRCQMLGDTSHLLMGASRYPITLPTPTPSRADAASSPKRLPFQGELSAKLTERPRQAAAICENPSANPYILPHFIVGADAFPHCRMKIGLLRFLRLPPCGGRRVSCS